MEHDSQLSPNLNSLLALIETNKRLYTMSEGDSPPVRFLPEGEHILRFFPDPGGELLRVIGIHRRGMFRTHCPIYLEQCDPAAGYPDCAICPLAARRNDWQLRMQQLTLCYGYVCQTSHENKFWKPGRPCLVVGSSQMYKAFCTMMESMLTSHKETLSRMLNHRVPGCAIRVSVTKGRRLSVTMTPYTATSFPAIKLGQWYRPLEQCWLRPEFSLDDYQTLLRAVEAEGDNLKG